MKRDWDLLRLLLKRAEAIEFGDMDRVRDLEQYSERAVFDHVRMLKEAGLIQVNLPNLMGQGADILWLTWAGHEFLDNARDDTAWARTKAKLSATAGSASIGVITALLTAEVKRALGLP